MNIFGKVTWKAMWKNRVRTLVTVAGVILSAAMFTAVTTMAASLVQFLIDVEVYEDGAYYLSYDVADSAVGDALRADEDVDEIGDYQAMGYVKLGEEDSDQNYYIMACADPALFDLAGVRPVEGRLPRSSDEVLLPARAVARLQTMGLPHSVGDTVTLEILPQYGYEETGLPAGTETVSRTYTVVGIAEDGLYLGAEYEWIPSIVTLADGTQPALWHRYYATTHTPKAAYAVTERITAEDGVSLHYDLLNYYGVSRYSNYNHIMTSFVVILIAIIMVGSVSLIYNAFSISVSERTKQFGLLSGIGATKRQIRRSVFFEAAILCLLGIPIGLVCGWGGIAVTLHYVGDMFADMLHGATEGGITLGAVISPGALAAAASVGVLTVLVSAWIPARRATRISPMAAIRQVGDYRVTHRAVRVSPLSYRIWGLPGVLAKKYYSVSRKKYRATVVSLAVSLFLFITATSYAGTLRRSVELSVNTENYDFMACWVEADEIGALCSHDAVTQAAVLRTDTSYCIFAGEGILNESYLQWLSQHAEEETGMRRLQTCIYFLQDDVFTAYLEEQKIDPQPCFDEEAPMALVCGKTYTTYVRNEKTDAPERYTYRFAPFGENVQTIGLLYAMVPQELYEAMPDETYTAEYLMEEGRILLEMTPWSEHPTQGYFAETGRAVYYEIVSRNGAQVYYAYDMETGVRAAEPTYVQDTSDTLQGFRLGATVSELPFGIGSGAVNDLNTAYFILPLSAAKGEPQYGTDVALKTSDYEALKTYLDDNEIPYTDELSDEMQARNIILLVNVFSYGFIVLIALICVCNVFNTISTNIALRRRDFGMLRSVGLKTRELYRMMHFECLRYGIKALAAGLPLALLSSYGIYTLMAEISDQSWQPPWTAMAVAAGSIFLVVFATMLYAVSKLRKDNPIEAIRMENL